MYAEEHPHTIDRKTGKLEIMAVNIIYNVTILRVPVHTIDQFPSNGKACFSSLGLPFEPFEADEAKWKCKCTFGYEGDPKIPGLEQGSIEGHFLVQITGLYWSVCTTWAPLGWEVGFLMPRCQSEWRKQALQLCKIACFEGPFHIEGECKPISGDLA